MKKFSALLMGALACLAVVVVTPSLAESSPINVNTASNGELISVNGIGPAKAKAIIEHRDANGAFASVEDLRSVPGIGDRLLERLRPQVTVGETTPEESE